jgi:putative nucleotidyltransferase with HDIG domain
MRCIPPESPAATASSAEDLLRQASALPPAPLVSLKLWRLLRSEDVPLGEIAELVRYDERLCALVLRLASGAARGVRDVRSIDQAVLALGVEVVADAVVTLIGKGFLAAGGDYSGDRVRLWRHSVTSAVAGEYIAEHATRLRVDPSTAYTAGLLHDVGTSVIAHGARSELPRLIAFQSEQGCGWSAAEASVLGTDHPEVGSVLLRAWGLPGEIVTAVELHCSPDEDPSGLAGVVHLASLCAKVAADPHTRLVLEPALTPLVAEKMGFGSEVVESTLDHLGSQLERVEALVRA